MSNRPNYLILCYFIAFTIIVTGCQAGESDGPDSADEGIGDPSGDFDSRPEVKCVYDSVENPLTADEMLEKGPFPVGNESITFKDPARNTPPNGSYKGADGRRLASLIWFPGGPAAEGAKRPLAPGPFPLIIYNHGFFSSNDEASYIGRHLASHGYIVVSPSFPLTNMLAPGGPNMDDVHQQPGDVSFLIDQMVLKSNDEADRYFGAVDESRVAVTGISMGGMTTSLVSYHPTMHDPRIKAAATMAGPSSMFNAHFYDFRPVPILALHGDIDAIVNYKTNARRVLENARPYATLITIDGASHTGFAPIPFEAMVLPIMGELVAPPGSNPNNPDRLGCGVIAGSMPDNAEFLKPMGGAENGMVESDDPWPCGIEYLSEPAISPNRQRKLALQAVFAFMEAHLADNAVRRGRACQFLYEVFPATDGVTLE